jgi:N-acetylmuramic acid 6-phosphate etherase
MKAKKKPSRSHSNLFLGVECGGTRTVAIVADARGHCLFRRERMGSANLRLLSRTQLAELFREIAHEIPNPDSIGIGMAGVIEESERNLIKSTAARIWPGIPCWAGNDLETALAAASIGNRTEQVIRVIVVSGTGASCFGRDLKGKSVLTGGWGHLVGDCGGGHYIALRSLQKVFQTLDETGHWPALGSRLLRAAQLNSPNELISWLHGCSKGAVAALAREVFDAERAADSLAQEVLKATSAGLAQSAAACIGRLARPGQPVEVFFTGSILVRQPGFARRVGADLRKLYPGVRVALLEREGAWGAVCQARDLFFSSRPQHAVVSATFNPDPVNFQPLNQRGSVSIPVAVGGLSPTEMRNPRSAHLDRLSVDAAVALMLREESVISKALLDEKPRIVKAIHLIVRALESGGRLIYVGAGTSGRIGMLDASECPPTFNVPPERVQAIMAGGHRALWDSHEDVEDDGHSGAQAVICRAVGPKDVVMGIAASGRTPFVWGALQQARDLGAKTILVCFNPNLRMNARTRPTLIIAPVTGPEVLTGSTRLKAGTATKLLLNMFSTLAMVRLGKVVENLMVDVQPTNSKLRDRAVRILVDLAGTTPEKARAALERHNWSVPAALSALGRNLPVSFRV